MREEGGGEGAGGRGVLCRGLPRLDWLPGSVTILREVDLRGRGKRDQCASIQGHRDLLSSELRGHSVLLFKDLEIYCSTSDVYCASIQRLRDLPYSELRGRTVCFYSRTFRSTIRSPEEVYSASIQGLRDLLYSELRGRIMCFYSIRSRT